MAEEKYATMTAPGDGIKTVWDFNFAGAEGTPGYISKDHVKCYITTGITQVDVAVTPGMWVTPTSIRVTPAVAAGSTITIYRDTPKERPLVNFTTTAVLNEFNLDLAARQSVYASAEVLDQFATTREGLETINEVIEYVNIKAGEAEASAEYSADRATESTTSAAESASFRNQSQAYSVQSQGYRDQSQGYAVQSMGYRDQSFTYSQNSLASASAAALVLADFNRKYLGPKASDPSLDNNGQALIDGALYYNTTIPQMLVYTADTTSWGQLNNNTLRSGSGAPAPDLGFVGDFYVDIVDFLLYGPKALGDWGLGSSIKGPVGDGTGSMIGPATSTNNGIAVYNGTTGTILRQLVGSGILTSVSGVATLIQPGPRMTLSGGLLDSVQPGTELIAVLPVSAGVSIVSAPTVFSGQYDDYIVSVLGAQPSVNSSLQARLCVGGVEVSTASYANATESTNATYTFTSTSMTVGGGLEVADTGTCRCNLSFNGVPTPGLVTVIATFGVRSPSGFGGGSRASGYLSTAPVTGFTLRWSLGYAFNAGCEVRVYGIKRSM